MTFFSVSRIRFFCRAPQFWATKVPEAFMSVLMGCMKIVMIRRAAVCEAITVYPSALFAPWKATEPRSITLYMNAMAEPVERSSRNSCRSGRKSSFPGIISR